MARADAQPAKQRRRPAKAKTLDDLGGVASTVPFLHTDSRATAPEQLSRMRLKQAFEWELAPQWPVLAGADASAVLRHVGAAAGAVPSQKPTGFCVGRAAVERALRRRELAALILARDAGPALPCAHLAALAQESATPVGLLACSSAQLGQPFGLLRTSAVGLRTARSGGTEEDALVTLLTRVAQRQQPVGPLPWLSKARDGLQRDAAKRPLAGAARNGGEAGETESTGIL